MIEIGKYFNQESSLNPVIFVVGARPNFIKMAPLLRAMSKQNPSVVSLLVHTGQHYDKNMNDQLFLDLDLGYHYQPFFIISSLSVDVVHYFKLLQHLKVQKV